MSLTLMPASAGAGDLSSAGSALRGFFYAAQPPNQSPAPERSELLRKSRRENPGLVRLFMQLLLGPPGEKMMAAFVPTVLVQEQAAQAACCGRGALPWNVVRGQRNAQRRRCE